VVIRIEDLGDTTKQKTNKRKKSSAKASLAKRSWDILMGGRGQGRVAGRLRGPRCQCLCSFGVYRKIYFEGLFPSAQLDRALLKEGSIIGYEIGLCAGKHKLKCTLSYYFRTFSTICCLPLHPLDLL